LNDSEIVWDPLVSGVVRTSVPRPRAHIRLRLLAPLLPPAVPAAKPLAPTASCGYKRSALPWSSSILLLSHRTASAPRSHPTSPLPHAVPTPTTRARPVSTFSSSSSWCLIREARQPLWRTCELPAARSVRHRAPHRCQLPSPAPRPS
jgi:hypothetical protein